MTDDQLLHVRLGGLRIALGGVGVRTVAALLPEWRRFACAEGEPAEGVIHLVCALPAPEGEVRFRFDTGDGAGDCRMWVDANGWVDYDFDSGSRVRCQAECPDEAQVQWGGSADELRYLLWLAYAHLALHRGALPVHASTVVHGQQAILFLGESGTGKSTHSRLWLQHIEGTHLLNDDSPIVYLREGQVWVSGSPWSGKAPCYRAETYPVKAFVRLHQAPHNAIDRLSLLPAFGALQPSCPPTLMKEPTTADRLIDWVGRIIERVPLYGLGCRPDAEAAMLCYNTITTER